MVKIIRLGEVYRITMFSYVSQGLYDHLLLWSPLMFTCYLIFFLPQGLEALKNPPF
jgi:tellurite resistance protein TehA-like permease